MTNEFLNKPTKIQPAIVGTIANPDDYNNNIAGQSKGSIVPIDENGNYKDGDLGNEAIIANGALINNLKMRQGGLIKIYDSAGNFLNNVSFGDATQTTKGFSLLNKRIVISNNVTTPNSVINASSGTFNFDDGSGQVVLPSLTGDLNSLFSGGGMLDIGAKAALTTYHIFAVYNPTSNLSRLLASLSATSPTLPGGYTKKLRIGSVRTDGSSNIRQFFQNANKFEYKTPVLDVNTTLGTSGTLYTISSPTGVITEAILNCFITGGGGEDVFISNPAIDDIAPSKTAAPLAGNLVNPGGGSNGPFRITTNTSSQIRARSTGGSTTFRLSLLGWIDLTLTT